MTSCHSGRTSCKNNDTAYTLHRNNAARTVPAEGVALDVNPCIAISLRNIAQTILPFSTKLCPFMPPAHAEGHIPRSHPSLATGYHVGIWPCVLLPLQVYAQSVNCQSWGQQQSTVPNDCTVHLLHRIPGKIPKTTPKPPACTNNRCVRHAVPRVSTHKHCLRIVRLQTDGRRPAQRNPHLGHPGRAPAQRNACTSTYACRVIHSRTCAAGVRHYATPKPIVPL